MKRLLSFVMLFFITLSNLMPVTYGLERSGEVLADQPIKPYERVIASNGNWYTEQIDMDGANELIMAWEGEYVVSGDLTSAQAENMVLKVSEDYVLGSIVIPFQMRLEKAPQLLIKDAAGNLYGPFLGAESLANLNTSDQRNPKMSGIAQNAVNYVFAPSIEIELLKGQYEMMISDPVYQIKDETTGASGAFIVKGTSLEGYKRYMESLKAYGDEENLDGQVFVSKEVIGSDAFVPDDLKDYKYLPAEKPPTKKKAIVKVENDSLVTNIVFNTYNEGKGAAPGVIAILDAKGEVVEAYESIGKSLGGIANGAWLATPNMILPEGIYELAVSAPEAIQYDKKGNPEFYVTLEKPQPMRVDFTGTYKINFDAYKRSTLMGPVADNDSDFSVKDFELTILDKGESIEVIGVYEKMPFSQECAITEASDDSLVAQGRLSADLKNLPAKTKIAADFTITLSQKGKKNAQMTITGMGTYERAASKTKGADYNTYELKGSGKMQTSEIPAYVAAALASATKGVGNIPGPDSTSTAVVGLLFPPLVGLVIHVLQELLSKAAKKEEETPKIKKYSKEWYKQQNPGMSDESIAWAMLADAGGGSDDSSDASEGGGSEGDSAEGSGSEGGSEGDADYGEEGTEGSENNDSETSDETEEDFEDEGDSNEGEDAEAEEDSEGDEGDSEEEEAPEDETEGEDEDDGEDEDSEGSEDEDEDSEGGEDDTSEDDRNSDVGEEGGEEDSEAGFEDAADQEDKFGDEAIEKPETLTLQVDHTGRTVEYVKDKATGEWVNPETGGILDLERYEKDVKPNFEKDKEFIDAQRDKLEKGDTAFDKELRQQAEERRAAEEKAAYIEKLGQKYGTTDEAELKQIIADNQAKDQANAESWNKFGDRLETAENVTKVVGVVADNMVDGLANVTGPAGAQIRAVYKVTKGVAGNMAENGVNATSFVSGAIKGGADAATDFIDSNKTKGAVTVLGEVLGGAVQDGIEGAKGGIVDGVSKVAQGALMDKLGGGGYGNQTSTMDLGNGSVRVAINTGGKWVGKNLSESSASKFIAKKLMNQGYQTTVKTVGGLLDEFGVKPNITEPIKDSLKSSK